MPEAVSTVVIWAGQAACYAEAPHIPRRERVIIPFGNFNPPLDMRTAPSVKRELTARGYTVLFSEDDAIHVIKK